MSEYFADYEAEDETDDRKLVSCCRCLFYLLFICSNLKFFKFQNNEHAPLLCIFERCTIRWSFPSLAILAGSCLCMDGKSTIPLNSELKTQNSKVVEMSLIIMTDLWSLNFNKSLMPE